VDDDASRLFCEVNPAEPVCHVSYYEADAYARWADARLATQSGVGDSPRVHIPIEGNFVEEGLYHPTPLNSASTGGKLAQMYGDVWEWTQSAYLPHPGYKASTGCRRRKYTGSSCVTSLYCAEVHVQRPFHIFGQLTETSFPPMPVGNLWVFDSRTGGVNITQHSNFRCGSMTLNRSGNTFLEEVLQGLQNQAKELPSKYFYDERGSRLFDKFVYLMSIMSHVLSYILCNRGSKKWHHYLDPIVCHRVWKWKQCKNSYVAGCPRDSSRLCTYRHFERTSCPGCYCIGFCIS